MKHKIRFTRLAVLTLILAWVSVSHGGNLLPVLSLNQTAHEASYSVTAGSPFQLKNDFGVPLHQTTIVLEPGHRLAVIASIAPGQFLDLEFPRQGRYSICFDLSQEAAAESRKCIPLNVRPKRAASMENGTVFSAFSVLQPKLYVSLKGASS